MSDPAGPGDPKPLVSVLIPTHNRPQWLPAAVRSVLDGEFGDYELIVSNNGDPEHTRRLAAEIDDPRVRWVEHDRSSGAFEHMLSLYGRARGKYVAVLHDDDWWDRHYLAALVPPLEERDDAVLAFGDHHEVDSDGRLDEKAAEQMSARFGRTDRPTGYATPFFDVAARQSAGLVGSVIRRDALDAIKVPADVELVDDLWIVYQLARTGKAVYFCRERLLYLRAHEQTLTSKQFVESYTGAIRCRELMLDDPGMAEYADELRGMLARDHMSAAAALLRQHRRCAAREHLLRAMRLRPHPKAAGALLASWVAPTAVLDRI